MSNDAKEQQNSEEQIAVHITTGECLLIMCTTKKFGATVVGSKAGYLRSRLDSIVHLANFLKPSMCGTCKLLLYSLIKTYC